MEAVVSGGDSKKTSVHVDNESNFDDEINYLTTCHPYSGGLGTIVTAMNFVVKAIFSLSLLFLFSALSLYLPFMHLSTAVTSCGLWAIRSSLLWVKLWDLLSGYWEPTC